MTLEKHDINRGLQRIVESYQKEAPSDEAKSKTNLLKEEWYHFEYASGANPYIAFSKKERDRILRKYKGKVEDLGDNHYLINDDEYISNYNEALSDEARANNEMIDKILSKSSSKLTKAEKEFLTKNGLTRHNDNYDPAIQKGNAILYKGQQLSRSHKDKDKVDKLDYLNKRDERSIHSEDDSLRANRARRNNFKDTKKVADRWNQTAIQHPEDQDYARKMADKWNRVADANYAFHSNKFAESIEEDDYFDFEADLAKAVKNVGLKWKGRGLSSSDVVKALDNLSVKFEDDTFDDEVD